MRLQRVHAEGDYLDVPFFEFALGPGHGSEQRRILFEARQLALELGDVHADR